MAYTTAEKNAIADYEVTRGAYYSVHTASPGGTGANEASGGSYARQLSTFSAASAGSAVGSQVTVPVPAGTFTHWARWSASTGGTVREDGAFSASQGNSAAASEIKITPTIGPVS